MFNLSDEHHERLWRICDTLVSNSGARSALVCDEANGAVLVSIGDASAGGTVSNVQKLSAQEFAVEGDAGQIYGVNIPGGAILLVLHDAGALERVRAVAAEATPDIADLLAALPPAVPEPEREHDHAHDGSESAAPRKKPRPAKKVAKKRAPKKPAKPAAKKKRAPVAKPKARAKSKPKRKKR